MKTLTWEDVERLVLKLNERIEIETMVETLNRDGLAIGLYGIPRGGSIVAAMLACSFPGYQLVDDIMFAGVVVDDLVDSGRTAERAALAIEGGDYGCDAYFDALIRKPHSPKERAPEAKEIDDWVVFPWELTMGDDSEQSAEDAVVRIIERVGEDPTREGLIETPKRVVKAFAEMTEGYRVDPMELCKVFYEENADEMVVLQNIDFVSLCEHHLLPFTGTISVGYIPAEGRVIGLSKIARIVHAFSRRFQVQERLTHQVASFLMDHPELRPLGAGAVVKGVHSCMTCRGVREQGATMVTSATYGVIREDAGRSEFLRLAL
jgi:GTP cyclohydrolase I